MTRVAYSIRARRDLRQIGNRIAADNPRAALAFSQSVRARCALLRTAPRSGQMRPDMAADIRSVPHGNYIIYYRYAAEIDRVEILRVFHGSRQQTAAEILS